MNLNNLISSGLLFKLWELMDNYRLESSHKNLQARLSNDPALFLVNCDAGIPPSCDYMRSALSVGQSYASALGEAKSLLKETKTVIRKCVDACDDVDSKLRDCDSDSEDRTKARPELKKIESIKFRLQNLAGKISS